MRKIALFMGITVVLHVFAGATMLLAQPHVDYVYPEQNELDVSVLTTITVRWDVTMDPESINMETFVVNGSSTGRHEGQLFIFPNYATLHLDDPFEEGEVVTVVLTAGIEDENHNPLDPPFVWSFTIGADDGSGIFASPENYEVGDHPYSVYAADLDGDGDLDLVTANQYSDDVSVLIYNGVDYDPHVDYQVGVDDGPYAVTAADFDSDDDLDLATANIAGDNVSVLLNNGDGTFVFDDDYAVGNGPRAIFAADLDSDGDLDLATANQNTDNVSVLLNNGDGTFVFHANYPVGDWPQSVFAADLDGDNDIDLATSNRNDDDVSVLLSNGDLTYVRADFEVDDDPQSVVAADLDGDGDLDLATANWTPNSVSILIYNGTDYDPHVDYPAGNSPTSVFAADLDGDGDLDLTTANINGADVSVLLNPGDGTFPVHFEYPVGSLPYSVFAADLDGDGELDLVVSRYFDDNVSVILNMHRPLVISTSPPQNELNVPVNATISVEFDFDMDETTVENNDNFVVHGRTTGLHQGAIDYNAGTRTATLDPNGDFVVGEVVTVTLTTAIESAEDVPLDSPFVWSFTIEADDGSGIFAPHSDYPAGDPYFVFAADLDGVGRLDLATANEFDNTISVLLHNGVDYDRVDYGVGDSPWCVIAADLDGDLDLDLAVANYFSDDVSVLFNDGFGSFVLDANYAARDHTRSIVAADFDGDGDLDLAAGNAPTHFVSVLLNNGDGTFADRVDYQVDNNNAGSVTAGDFDGDADFDLAIASAGDDNVSILLNNGDATFVFDGAYVVGDVPRCVFAADLEGDGDVDLATANEGSGDVSFLINIGLGNFIRVADYDVGEFPQSVFAADLDGDGALDLATANRNDDNVSVLLNYGDGTFADQVPYAVDNGPMSVFAADLDDDGELDLATANRNDNTVSVLLNMHMPHVVYASPAQNESNVPVSTTISVEFDFDMDETTVENSDNFVVHGRSSGPHQGAIVYDGETRTATFYPDDDFDVGEVVTVILTSDIETAEDIPLVDGFIWSFTTTVDDGLGSFGPHSVYPAGDAPVSVFAADLDGDGDLDLATANSESDNVSVLLNNGDGTFVLDGDYIVGQNPLSVFAADCDGDGDLDLTTSNCSDGNVSILLNNGDGTFVLDGDYTVGDCPIAVLAADLNGDGYLDLAIANLEAYISVLLYDSELGTYVQEDYLLIIAPRSIIAADLDRDGHLDLATAECMEEVFNGVPILWNHGDGTFEVDFSAALPQECPYSVFAADLNGDTLMDLVAANRFNFDDNISVIVNDGNRLFQNSVEYDVGEQPYSVYASDLDGDGDIDLVVANIVDGNVSVLLNNGDGTFPPTPPPYPTYEVGAEPHSVCAADLDGDGDIDLATANFGSDDVSVLLNINHFVRGDADADGNHDLFDGLRVIFWIGGHAQEPPCLNAADAEDDEDVDLFDGLRIIYWLGGEADPPPEPCCAIPADCGTDPTPGPLNSNNYQPCEGGAPAKAVAVVGQREKSLMVVGTGEVQEGTAVVPVTMVNTEPLVGFSFIIEYDPELLVAKAVDNTGLITEDVDVFVGGVDEPGLVKVVAVSDVDVANGVERLPAGEHQVARVIFEVTKTLDGDVALALTEGAMAVGHDGALSHRLVDGVIKPTIALPTEFGLFQSYPNPFNPTTVIPYHLPAQRSAVGDERSASVTLRVYNIAGQVVRTLVDEPQGPGAYRIVWDGRDDRGREVASGVYFYRLRAGEHSAVRKLVLMR